VLCAKNKGDFIINAVDYSTLSGKPFIYDASRWPFWLFPAVAVRLRYVMKSIANKGIFMCNMREDFAIYGNTATL